MRAVNIQWDTDGDKDVLVSLPSEAHVPDDLAIDSDEDVGNWLSDEYGFCHSGFDMLPEKHVVRINQHIAFLPKDAYWELCWMKSDSDLRDMSLILYNDTDPKRLKQIQGASFPCWAVFSYFPGGEGCCEGTLARVSRRWHGQIAKMVLDADEAGQRYGLTHCDAFPRYGDAGQD